MTPEFVNPYKHLDENDSLRVCVNVAKSEAARVKATTMDFGTLQIAIAMLVKKLYNHVITNHLTVDDREQFIAYLTNLLGPDAVPLGAGPPTGGPQPTQPRRDVRRRARPMDQGDQGTTDKSATSC
jgi:hypothetical protein